MARFLARRLGYYLLLVVLATFLSYLLASAALDPRANFEGRSPRPPAAAVNASLDAIGVNDHTPVLIRFARWSGHALAGDLGRTVDGGSVNGEFGRRVGVTVRLLLAGTIVGTVGGIAAGAWSAVRQYRLGDRLVTVGSFLILATPPFLLAVLLKVGAIAFNHTAGAEVIRFTGESTPGLSGGVFAMLWDHAVHLLLPTLAIGLGAAALYSRYQRNTMLDVLAADYIRSAQARGLRRRRALLKHGLRTALIPMSTFFAYNFLAVFTSAIFTEKIFGWNGVNAWFIDSAGHNDVNAIVAISLFAAVLVLASGLFADILLAALDPRVRGGGGRPSLAGGG